MIDKAFMVQLALLSVLLASVSLIDMKTRRIPDLAVVILALAGAVTTPSAPLSALASSLLFFLFFLAVRKMHMMMTGRIGLGFGDVKLAGAMGFWLPAAGLPTFIAVAAISALSFILVYSFATGNDISRYRLPFAPFMCLSFVSNYIYFEYIVMNGYSDDWVSLFST